LTESIRPLCGGVFPLDCGDSSPLLFFCFSVFPFPRLGSDLTLSLAVRSEQNKSGDKSPHSKEKQKTATERRALPQAQRGCNS
jgi:hypothetical protein